MTDFETELLAKIKERESILFEIERVLFTKRYDLSKKHHDIFAIQSISMMYSIWEGFIQQVFGLYISELNSLNIDFKDFSDGIQIFHLENTFKQFNEYPEKSKQKALFYHKLDAFFKTQRHSIYRQVNTQSNVSFEVLNKLLESFGLEPFEKYWKIYKHPNNLADMMKTFLNYRNGIAHGGDISSEEKITQLVYERYKQMIIDLMYGVYEKMMVGLATKSYIRVS
jgi:RiboL-PSP-HEPN